MAKRSSKVSEQVIEKSTSRFIGIDIGDRKSDFCVMNEHGTILEEGKVPSRVDEFGEAFARFKGAKALIEVGTHARWMKVSLENAGLECTVCDAKAANLVNQHGRKTDARDARMLAELLRTNSALIKRIEFRSDDAQLAMTILQCRGALVEARAKLVNCVTSRVKPFGIRLKKTSTDAFGRTYKDLPSELKAVMNQTYMAIAALTEAIDQYETKIHRIAAKLPAVEQVTQVPGVGDIIGLAFVLTIFNPNRFKSVRDVAAYLGLVPHERSSGDSHPQMRISKQGNGFTRKLMVQAAHYLLGPLNANRDSDLRRFGLRIAGERGGSTGKKKAVIAVARKLACLLLTLWKTGQKYEPLRNAKAVEAAAAAARA